MIKTRCPKCKREFVCGNNGNDPCWCAKLPNVVPMSSSECMCPNCLTKEIGDIKKERTIAK